MTESKSVSLSVSSIQGTDVAQVTAVVTAVKLSLPVGLRSVSVIGVIALSVVDGMSVTPTVGVISPLPPPLLAGRFVVSDVGRDNGGRWDNLHPP